jgi:hypothetical protein
MNRIVSPAHSPARETSRPPVVVTAVDTEIFAPPRECTDLRRRRRRELVQRVIDRAAWLAPADRLLIESIYRDHRSVADIARLAEVDPRSLRRRVRRVVRRVLSPRFAFVASRVVELNACRTIRLGADGTGASAPASERTGSHVGAVTSRDSTAWGSVRRRIAAECYINGRSIRDVAHMLNLSMHAVRRHRDAVEAVFQAARG